MKLPQSETTFTDLKSNYFSCFVVYAIGQSGEERNIFLVISLVAVNNLKYVPGMNKMTKKGVNIMSRQVLRRPIT